MSSTHAIHKGAVHGYALPDRDIFDKHAAERDWELIFAMFHRQIPPIGTDPGRGRSGARPQQPPRREEDTMNGKIFVSALAIGAAGLIGYQAAALAQAVSGEPIKFGSVVSVTGSAPASASTSATA